MGYGPLERVINFLTTPPRLHHQHDSRVWVVEKDISFGTMSHVWDPCCSKTEIAFMWFIWHIVAINEWDACITTISILEKCFICLPNTSIKHKILNCIHARRVWCWATFICMSSSGAQDMQLWQLSKRQAFFGEKILKILLNGFLFGNSWEDHTLDNLNLMERQNLQPSPMAWNDCQTPQLGQPYHVHKNHLIFTPSQHMFFLHLEMTIVLNWRGSKTWLLFKMGSFNLILGGWLPFASLQS